LSDIYRGSALRSTWKDENEHDASSGSERGFKRTVTLTHDNGEVEDPDFRNVSIRRAPINSGSSPADALSTTPNLFSNN